MVLTIGTGFAQELLKQSCLGISMLTMLFSSGKLQIRRYCTGLSLYLSCVDPYNFSYPVCELVFCY
jgi:hypothetical protein